MKKMKKIEEFTEKELLYKLAKDTETIKANSNFFAWLMIIALFLGVISYFLGTNRF